MKDMFIDKNFEDNYLTVGKTYDNFLFENCPNEFISIAREKLTINSNDTKSIVLNFDSNLANHLRKSLNNFDYVHQQQIICRDLISSMFLRELLNYKDYKHHTKESLDKLISVILGGNKDEIIDNLPNSPYPYEIESFIKKIGKIELNIFLKDIINSIENNEENTPLQQAINNYLSSRTSYSVKVFSNNPLCTFYDQMGNPLQPPHDFLVRDVNKFITFGEQEMI